MSITKNNLPDWIKTLFDVEETPQRLTDGTGEFCGTITSLTVSFVRMGIALYTFIPMLWQFSTEINFSFVRGIKGVPYWVVALVSAIDGVPGILVWITLSVGLVCMVVALIVNAVIPGLEWKNQNNEGMFRKNIERVERSKPTMTNHLRSELERFVIEIIPDFEWDSENRPEIEEKNVERLLKKKNILYREIERILVVFNRDFKWDLNKPGVIVDHIQHARVSMTVEETIKELEEVLSTLARGYFKTFSGQFASDIWRTIYNQAMAMSLPLLFGGGVITGAIKLGTLSAAGVAIGEVNGVFSSLQSGWLGYMRFLSVIMRIRELRKNIINKTLDKEAAEKARWSVRGRRATDVAK